MRSVKDDQDEEFFLATSKDISGLVVEAPSLDEMKNQVMDYISWRLVKESSFREFEYSLDLNFREKVAI